MTITHQVYDTATLMGVYRELEPVPNFFLSLAFGNQVNFDDEFIDFEKINEHRKLAPLVVPTAQGKPMYSQASRTTRLKPAYIKPKDPVTATSLMRRKAGQGELLAPNPQSPRSRYNSTVAEIVRQHREGIERRWEWMAAEALLNGTITLEDEAYPRTVVDFGRDAGHTVVLGAGSRWGEAGVSPLDDLEGWGDTMMDAEFGGPTAAIVMGPQAWKAFRSDDEVEKRLLNNQIRNSGAQTIDLGMGNNEKVQYKGDIAPGVGVWVHSDYYEDAANPGTAVRFMDTRDVLLVGSNVLGTRCFGAIQDLESLQAVEVFPTMWPQKDPSAMMIMHQSAPLMVPVNPNSTFRARVLA